MSSNIAKIIDKGTLQRWLKVTSLNKRDSQQWEYYISKLPESWRAHIASIVWWDFIADRGSSSQAFQEYLKMLPSQLLEDSLIVRGLCRVGYPKKMALLKI